MTAISDPFSKWRANKLPVEPTQEVSPSVDQSDPFSKWRSKKSEDPGFFQEFGRHAARIGSRVAETIGGIPGDIQDLIQSGVFYGLEKLTGHKATPELRKEAALKSERAPTTSELKEISEKSTKGFTKARGPGEEIVDEFASTVASLLGPMKFRKALGLATLGTGAKKGAEILGLGENSQEAAKLGTILISSMINPKGVKQLYSNYYNEARKLAPEGTFVSAKPLEAKLNRLEKKLTEGTLAPTEKAVLDELEKVRGKIKDGKVDIREMMATNRSINEKIGDPELLKRGKNLFPELKKAVNDSIKLYSDPKFLKAWKSANESFAGVHESQKISRFINKHLGNMPIKHALFVGLGETISGHPEAILPTVGAAIGAGGVVKSIELMQRIFSNPTLRKYYLDVLVNASKENASSMRKSAKKIQEELEN